MARLGLTRRSPLAAALAAALAGGCAVGPKYQQPQVPTPPQYRGLEGPAQAESLADLPWWEVFQDPALVGLIHEALLNNFDLRVAAARVEQARAQAGIAKSFLFPQVGFDGGYTAQQVSRLSQPPQGTADDKTYQNWSAGFTLSWEIDIFGRIRREKEAAVARWLATEEARRGVVITLVADVASNYFFLRQLDRQLEIGRQTLKSNQEQVDFYQNRLVGGVSNRLEVDQSVANRARTAATLPDIERQIAITENAISLLLGHGPSPIPRGASLTDQHLPPQVPAGLPATLLQRRPDVLGAEQLLVSANAQVGAAKALFFPTINLTGLLGGVSGDLSNILKADAGLWSLGGGLFQPIFQGGRIRQNYAASKAQFDEALAQYEKSAQNSYREVADALVTIQKTAEQRVVLREGVTALRDAAKLSRSRYDTGLANYLEILIADQQLFDQELALAATEGAQLRALADFYRALGGGWPPQPAPAPAPPPPPPATTK